MNLDEVRPPDANQWAVRTSAVAAAITGRRIAAHVTTHDDAVSELHAVQQQLTAAQAQIADMGAELASQKTRLAATWASLKTTMEANEDLARQLKAEQAEVARLTHGSQRAEAPPGIGTLEPVVSQDRRALVQLQGRIDDLLRENEQLKVAGE